MKKVILLAVFAVIGGLSVFAQKVPFSSAIGLRVGVTDQSNTGLTFKHYNSALISYEILALTDFDHGAEFSGLIQYNGIFPDVPSQFRYVLGGGAHVGYWSGMTLGADGMAGLEYTFREIPLNLAFDWHPLLNIIDPSKKVQLYGRKFGLSVRYVFK